MFNEKSANNNLQLIESGTFKTNRNAGKNETLLLYSDRKKDTFIGDDFVQIFWTWKSTANFEKKLLHFSLNN